MANVRFHRKGVDPGLDGVRDWIGRWCEDASDLRIREIAIPCPTRKDIKDPKRGKAFRSASQRNETPLHSYLKFAAWTWLSSTIGKKAIPQYETRMYLPIEEHLKGVTVKAGTFDPRKPRILTNDEKPTAYTGTFASPEFLFANLGDIITVDVYCEKRSVEVGKTQPYNLCMPLFTGLVRSAVWIPYPRGIAPDHFSPGDLSAVVAYEITCKAN